MGFRFQDYPGGRYVRIEGVNYPYEFFKVVAEADCTVTINIERNGETIAFHRVTIIPTPAGFDSYSDTIPAPEPEKPRRRRKSE